MMKHVTDFCGMVLNEDLLQQEATRHSRASARRLTRIAFAMEDWNLVRNGWCQIPWFMTYGSNESLDLGTALLCESDGHPYAVFKNFVIGEPS